MTWHYLTPQGRNGSFRNLLQLVHQTVEARAKELSEVSAEVRPPGGSTDKGALVDLLYLMICEHAQYRQNLRQQDGDYYDASDTSTAMKIDNREQIAEHLAAARAEARLMETAVPQTWHDLEEDWMLINERPGRTGACVDQTIP